MGRRGRLGFVGDGTSRRKALSDTVLRPHQRLEIRHFSPMGAPDNRLIALDLPPVSWTVLSWKILISELLTYPPKDPGKSSVLADRVRTETCPFLHARKVCHDGRRCGRSSNNSSYLWSRPAAQSTSATACPFARRERSESSVCTVLCLRITSWLRLALQRR
jgi:hypothetical protein